MQAINAAIANWQTTIAGVGLIFVAVGNAAYSWADGDPTTQADLNLVAAEIIAGLGLIMARTAWVSSRKSGIE